MLVGVAQQELVEVALERVDAAVDLGDRYRGRRRRLRQQHRLFADQLALHGVARVLGLAQFEPGLPSCSDSAPICEM